MASDRDANCTNSHEENGFASMGEIRVEFKRPDWAGLPPVPKVKDFDQSRMSFRQDAPGAQNGPGAAFTGIPVYPADPVAKFRGRAASRIRFPEQKFL